MARTKIDRYVSYHIPCIDIIRMSDKKADIHGKYIIKLDGKWKCATSDINKGFKNYISNPNDPDKNGIDKKCKEKKSLELIKTDYEFDGIIDYSLDLRHLIDYCDDHRLIRDYFKSAKGKNICLALVKINFEKNTKDIREFLYRQDGVTITYPYCINGKKQQISYIRYKRTASGAREGSCLFIAKTLFDPMINWSSAGIDPTKAKHIDSISWEAYIALTLSSIETTIKINPKQILFVKDQEVLIKNEKVFEIRSENNELVQRHRVYSDIEDEDHLIHKNKIWDGEGLIDSNLFLENEVLNNDYKDKCMLLLRGKLFKACVFRTHIQKWFSDNGISDATHKVSDLNGYTQAEKISDIRFIIPYSCLKFLKFKNENETEESAIKKWIIDIAGRNTHPLFGIIKSDKKSKLMDGKMVFTTYQMLNTLGFDEKSAAEFLKSTIDMMNKLALPGKDGAKNVKYYLDHLYFSQTIQQNNYGEEISDDSDTFRVFHYAELVASKLLEYDLKYYETSHYKKNVKSLLEHIKKQVMAGRVLIDGVYATLFCNGIELLKYAIDKNYHPGDTIKINSNGVLKTVNVLEKSEIYSKRFAIGEKLLCARNPHITMGNYYLATNTSPNKRCQKMEPIYNKLTETIYEKYFVLSDEIVCVNAIGTDIMNILNGCDFDSDTMLITNNPVMVQLLIKQLGNNQKVNKFRVPFNNVKSITITPDDQTAESLFLSTIDDKLSNNLIGEIINLSQRLNSLIWMLAPLDVQHDIYANWNKWTAEIGRDIYEKGCCTLAVLSNIEIDSAKRTYACDTKKELQKISAFLGTEYRKLQRLTSWLNGNSIYESPTINSDDTIMGLKIHGLDPMGYIIETITSEKEAIQKTIEGAPVQDYDFLTNMLRNCNILKSDSSCENSLNTCIDALIKCHDHINSQSAASKNNAFFNRSYANDCIEIIKCCSIINNTLYKNTVTTDALLWQLINLSKTSSRLVKISDQDKNYTIVDKTSTEYKTAKEENKHDCPRALLWAALFLGNFSDTSYLFKYLKTNLDLE